MTAYLLESNIVDHGQLLILVGVIWLKCELGLGVNLQLKHKTSVVLLFDKRKKSSSLQMQMHEYQKLNMGAQGSSTLDLNWNSTRNCPAQSAV